MHNSLWSHMLQYNFVPAGSGKDPALLERAHTPQEEDYRWVSPALEPIFHTRTGVVVGPH